MIHTLKGIAAEWWPTIVFAPIFIFLLLLVIFN